MVNVPIKRIYMNKEQLVKLHYDLGQLEKHLASLSNWKDLRIEYVRRVEQIIEKIV